MTSPHKSKPTYAAREETALEAAVNREWNAAQRLLSVLATAESVETHVPELHGAIFCGHLVADLDSVAGAIGAAALYGGVPARASEVNSETEFALATWGIDLSRIRPVEQLLEEQGDSARVCLVDFQQTTQLHPAIQPSKIVGVIDHHALQSSTIVTQRPIFVDIRPWGSMSTIIAHSFVVLQRPMPREVGGLLLQASRARSACAASRLHLGCLSAASRLPLGCLSTASRLHLGCLSAASRLHLGRISAASRLHLGRISRRRSSPTRSTCARPPPPTGTARSCLCSCSTRASRT